MQPQLTGPVVYQGQFGEFTINQHDRQGVIIYRSGLMIAALSFAIATALVLGQYSLSLITPLFWIFWAALGVSLWTIHIYLAVLHRVLQAFWVIGGIAALWIALQSPEPLALYVYEHPVTILGVGFTFAALTGIFFKEAFCFDRIETKVSAPLVPILLLGHLTGLFAVQWEQILLGAWAILFLVFAFRKTIQAIPPDIGDKSVFQYLKSQHHQKHVQGSTLSKN